MKSLLKFEIRPRSSKNFTVKISRHEKCVANGKVDKTVDLSLFSNWNFGFFKIHSTFFKEKIMILFINCHKKK